MSIGRSMGMPPLQFLSVNAPATQFINFGPIASGVLIREIVIGMRSSSNANGRLSVAFLDQPADTDAEFIAGDQMCYRPGSSPPYVALHGNTGNAGHKLIPLYRRVGPSKHYLGLRIEAPGAAYDLEGYVGLSFDDPRPLTPGEAQWPPP